jgi:HSP20 family protein
MGIQQTINKLLGEDFPARHPEKGALVQGWMFPVDIKDTPDAFLIKAEIPGINREDVKLSFKDNILTIRGERRAEEKQENENYIRIERSYGSFSRSFALDTPVKHEEIKARYKDGMLEITLPKEKESGFKEIDIDVT